MRRRRPNRISTPASRPRKYSPILATRATAVRGKLGQRARLSCGNIIPPAAGKRRQWPLIWPRSGAMRGRSNSGGPPRWARARRPRREPTKATAVGRPSRVSRRQARPPPARFGLGFPPRVWKRAICRLLLRREALLPRPVRRKPPWQHRRGRAASKPSRNSAKTATSVELASGSPPVVSDKRQSRNLSARLAPTRLRDRHPLAASKPRQHKDAIFSPLRRPPARSHRRPHAFGAPRPPPARRRPPLPLRPPRRLPRLP